MTDPITLSIGKALLDELGKRPDAIRGVWEAVLARTIGLPYPITITGHRGVGKTALLGNLAKKDYPEGPSANTEKEALRQERTRYVFTTVPGDNTATKREAEDKLYGQKGQRQGIVHLFANGYVTRRKFEPTEASTPEAVAGVIARERASEVNELAHVLGKIRDAHARGAGPTWLLLLHAKADLYTERAHELVGATREGRDDLAEKLSGLRTQLGSDKFSWGVAPLSVISEPLRVGGTVIEPKIDAETAERFMADFILALGRLAHGR